MKLSVNFPELTAQRERIGARLSNWEIEPVELSPREEFLNDLHQGIEIDLSKVEAGPGGLLAFKDEQIILYIKDTRSSQWTLIHKPENSRRFHLAECQTLKNMRNGGRFERYVVTNRMDGYFKVDWLDPDTNERGEMEAALRVCKHCLTEINWRGYKHANGRIHLPGGNRQQQEEIWQSFAISEFLMEFSTFFHSRPSRRDIDAPLNRYVHDWSRISERERRAANWRCESCGVNLTQHPGLLHCHHRNGVVTDNSRTNLMVLCAIDHAAQPGHQHMHVSPDAWQIIQTARTQQSIGPN